MLRNLEQELRVAEMRFRALVDHLPAAVYMHVDDADDTLIYIRPFFEGLTGFVFDRDNPCWNVGEGLGRRGWYLAMRCVWGGGRAATLASAERSWPVAKASASLRAAGRSFWRSAGSLLW